MSSNNTQASLLARFQSVQETPDVEPSKKETAEEFAKRIRELKVQQQQLSHGGGL